MNYWILILKMLRYQNLMALYYLFLTNTLQKKKYIRWNICTFMTKELRKAIMNRSKLRNKFLKTRNEESKRRFNRQKTLLRKTKRQFFGKTEELSLTIENFGKLSILSSRKRLSTKNILFWIITTKLLVIMRD